MDTPNSEGPEPGACLPCLPASLSLTTLGWQNGRVGPSFVVVLGAVGLAGPVLARLTKRTVPGGACAHHRWFLAGSSASEPCSGPGETAALEWEPRGLAGKQPSWAGGHWPLEGGGARTRVYVWWEYVGKHVRVCVYM